MELQKVLLSTTSNTSIGFECLYIVIFQIFDNPLLNISLIFKKIHSTPILKLFRYFMDIEYDILSEAFAHFCNIMSFEVVKNH
jgi:uncharacterized membrane protein YagU involved in acid resistance